MVRHRGEGRDDRHAAGGAHRVVGRGGDPDRHGERRAEAPRPRPRPRRATRFGREPEEQQPGERDGAGDAQDGRPGRNRSMSRVPSSRTSGHRADEDAEHDRTDRLGLGEAVDDGEREPVVRGALRQRGGHDDEADEHRPALAPGAERRPQAAAAPGRRADRGPGDRRAVGADRAAGAAACGVSSDDVRDRRQPPDERDDRGRRRTAPSRATPRCGQRRAEQRPDDGADGERGVELRDDGPAEPALDAGGLDVERHVAERERDAVEEDAGARAAATEPTVAARRRAARSPTREADRRHEQRRAAAEARDDDPGDRDRQQGADGADEQDAAELGGRQVERVAHGRACGRASSTT